jgi:hypothetical protein
MNEDYEGSFDIRRSVTSMFDFTVKGYVYNKFCEPTTGIIKNIDLDIGITAEGFTGNSMYMSDYNEPIYVINTEG